MKKMFLTAVMVFLLAVPVFGDTDLELYNRINLREFTLEENGKAFTLFVFGYGEAKKSGVFYIEWTITVNEYGKSRDLPVDIEYPFKVTGGNIEVYIPVRYDANGEVTEFSIYYYTLDWTGGLSQKIPSLYFFPAN